MSEHVDELSPMEVYGAFVEADYAADPFIRSLGSTRWLMGPDWYKALRRACLPPDADDEARDESKWTPDPDDMMLGRKITVTEKEGPPRLINETIGVRVPIYPADL
jgi:hypothetical protein